MKHRYIFLILILFFQSHVWLLSQNSFKFIAMSDSRGNDNGVNSEVLGALVDHIVKNQKDIKFVVFVGDMVDGNVDNPAQTRKELIQWKEVMSPIYNNNNMIEPKIYPVVGNHEIRNRHDENTFREVFNNTPQNGPGDEKGLTYSFDYGSAHFVILNSNRWYYGNPKDTTDDRRDWHYIKHLDWINNDLGNAKELGAKHIFAFSHEMLFPTGGHLRDGLPFLGLNFTGELDSTRQWYLDKRNKFWNILKQHNADAVICGHEHLYSRQSVDGIYQIVVGSAGAPLYFFNPTFEDDGPVIPGREMSYTNSIPYYEVLGYKHGPGKNSQMSEDFVGYRAFHYSVFEVFDEHVNVKTFGAYPGEGKYNSMGTPIELIDEFVID